MARVFNSSNAKFSATGKSTPKEDLPTLKRDLSQHILESHPEAKDDRHPDWNVPARINRINANLPELRQLHELLHEKPLSTDSKPDHDHDFKEKRVGDGEYVDFGGTLDNGDRGTDGTKRAPLDRPSSLGVPSEDEPWSKASQTPKDYGYTVGTPEEREEIFYNNRNEWEYKIPSTILKEFRTKPGAQEIIKHVPTFRERGGGSGAYNLPEEISSMPKGEDRTKKEVQFLKTIDPELLIKSLKPKVEKCFYCNGDSTHKDEKGNFTWKGRDHEGNPTNVCPECNNSGTIPTVDPIFDRLYPRCSVCGNRWCTGDNNAGFGQHEKRCNICGKTDCTGENGRGFGRHGGACKYCLSKAKKPGSPTQAEIEKAESCTGDDNMGFGIHKVTKATSPRGVAPSTKTKPVTTLPDAPRTNTRSFEETSFGDVNEALEKMLQDDLPHINEPTIQTLVHGGAETPAIGTTSRKRMVFNAAVEDENDYGKLQEGDHGFDWEAFGVKGLDEQTEEPKYDPGMDPDEDDSVYYGDEQDMGEGLRMNGLDEVLGPEGASGFQEVKTHGDSTSDAPIHVNMVECPNCHGESKKNVYPNFEYKPGAVHCKSCDGKCSSDESNQFLHCAGCKGGTRCKGREHEIWSIVGNDNKKTTECKMCHNEGEVPESYVQDLSDQIDAEKPVLTNKQRKKNKKTTPKKPSSFVPLEDYEFQTSTPDEDEEDDDIGKPIPYALPRVNDLGIKKDEQGNLKSVGLRFFSPKTQTESPEDSERLSGDGLTRWIDKTKTELAKPKAPTNTTKEGVAHIKCGCGKRGGRVVGDEYVPGLASDEEIGKIKQSDEYKQGLANINVTHPRGTPGRQEQINDFIAQQYKCRGDE